MAPPNLKPALHGGRGEGWKKKGSKGVKQQGAKRWNSKSLGRSGLALGALGNLMRQCAARSYCKRIIGCARSHVSGEEALHQGLTFRHH